MLVVCPHGVISFGGICSALVGNDFGLPIRQNIVDRFPTAVASVLINFPIMKHVLGIFGLLDASKKSLTRQIKNGKSFVLYPGGIAELFLSSPRREMLLVRKGFIKLALTTGADVIPLYLLGNTTVLEVMRHPALMKLSRSIGASLTFFWGRWNLPFPKPDPLIYVRAPPLGMPKIENPTSEDIDKWHKIYMNEVQRLFDTYKVLRPDFKDKVLTIRENEKEDAKVKTK
jgi:2-acylglycerol O-acyltransferase 2